LRFYLTICFFLLNSAVFAVTNGGVIGVIEAAAVVSAQNGTKPDSAYVNRLNKTAENFFNTNPDSTVYYADKSIGIARKINYKSGLAYALIQTGHASFYRGNYDQGKVAFEEAVSIFKDLNDKVGLGKCYTLYGRFYFLLDDYKLALNYLNQSLTISKNINNEPNIADCYKNFGIVYYGKGQLSTALDYYYKALNMQIKLQNKIAAADVYSDIGLVLQSMEMYPQALLDFKKALGIYNDTKDLSGVGATYINIGEVQLNQENYDRAIVYLNEALSIEEKLDDKEGKSSVYSSLGLCYAKKGQYALALDNLNKSLKIAQDYKIAYNEANVFISFATMYNLQKHYKLAYQYAVNGEKLAVELGNLTIRANAALQLHNAFAGMVDYGHAYNMLIKYNNLKDSLHSNESIQKLTSYNMALDFDQKQHQLANLQEEKDELFTQRIEQQRFIIAVSMILVLAMIAVSLVYYLQKIKQQKVNEIVLHQKGDLDEQAQKLNNLNTLKDRLISILAHDLRAPLSTLRGLFSLLQDETISPAQMLEMIPAVLKKLEYTSDFLDTLLFWINSQVDDAESSARDFRIREIVEFEIENYTEQAAIKGITLIDNVPGGLVAFADPNSIRIVIRNLVTNAIKFSTYDDRIEISARHFDENNHVISVRDTGTGMNEEQLGKIFKSKVSSEVGTNNETGTGMGMLFCKDLVEKSNGKIWVTSRLGVGTEFLFTIPVGLLEERPVVHLVN
jgi:two-component system, sensor histidine kinase and response regulator